MESTTNGQKKLSLAKFEASQSKRYFVGKVIVMVIASLNILLSIMSSVVNFNIFLLLIQIALSVALFLGVSWVRYLFAIGSALSAISGLYLLMVVISGQPVWITVFLIFAVLFNIVSCILLFANNGVSEFLYAQKNG